MAAEPGVRPVAVSAKAGSAAGALASPVTAARRRLAKVLGHAAPEPLPGAADAANAAAADADAQDSASRFSPGVPPWPTEEHRRVFLRNARNHTADRPSLLPGLRNQVLTVPRFRLESGAVLRNAEVAYQAFGCLDQDRRDNVLVVCHALSGSADVSDWWRDLVAPGRAIDTSRYLVVCCNLLGSPYGSTSPLSVNPATGRPYGKAFPRTTIRDSVRLHRLVLEHLGVRSVRAVIGGSLGGMQALEWALLFPSLVRSLVLLATCGRHAAWTIGLSETQRQALDAHPVRGLEVARQVALISYRSHASFQRRFGRKPAQARRVPGKPADQQQPQAADRQAAAAAAASPPGPAALFPRFSVMSYLAYQGSKFVERFDAECYRHITLAMDTHDVSRGRGAYEAVLGGIDMPCLVFGIESDLLYPVSEQRELAEHIAGARFVALASDDGHDAFLIDWPTIDRHLTAFLDGAGAAPGRGDGSA